MKIFLSIFIVLSAVAVFGADSYSATAYGTADGVYRPVIPAPEIEPGGTPRFLNNQPTDNYSPSIVRGNLNIEVDKDTREIRFIRDNADPYVITKAYEITKANPYAVRGYLLSMMRARQISASPTQVDALRFNDGTGLVLVSAEEYRFRDSEAGEGIDSIVRKLDNSKLMFTNNRTPYIYFPKINLAANLCDMVRKVGASNQDYEFINGPDLLAVDGELNAIVVSGADWSRKHVVEMLEAYDKPMPEVRVFYKVVEIYAENDDKVGVDYQSWKNNDGVDLFAVGGRYRRNWSTFFTGGVTNSGNNKTEYISFNPKWNTRYLDFLTSIGRAKLLTSGVLLAKNRENSQIQVDSGFFFDLNDAVINDDGTLTIDHKQPNVDVIPRQQLTKILPESSLMDLNPNMINNTYSYQTGLDQAKYLDNYWRVLFQLAGAAQYSDSKYVEMTNPSTGEKVKVPAAVYKLLTTGDTTQITVNEVLNRIYSNTDSTTDNATPGVIHGKMQLPQPKEGFIFNMSVTPLVTSKAATLDLEMSSISLIGWNGNGTPRQSNSSVSSKVQVAYSGQQFVIGGLKKVETVRSVSGLPWVKDIPYIGWLFTAESESIKRSQLVLVATVEYSLPDDKVSAKVTENIGRIVESVERGENSWVDNLGFQKLHRRDEHYVDDDLDNAEKSWVEDLGFRPRTK